MATDYTTPNGNNQITQTNARGVLSLPQYDAAGDMQTDGANQYLYDAEGRVCAVASVDGGGDTILTGYLYNGEGARVSKGTITAWSCDPVISGFATSNDYVLGLSGEQVTEMGMNSSNTLAFQHSNVYAAGILLATYDKDGLLHFYLNDPLGTRRAQTDYAGVSEQTCFSLPFGDSLDCSNSIQFPTEQHFTGKERDAESGNDYFGARYYASSMGRFMSPDWSEGVQPIPYADPANPQSLNLYAYVNNNPLSNTDQDGHSCDQGSAGPDGVFTFKCQNDPTLLDEFMQEIRTDPNQQRTLIAQKGLTLPNGHPLDAGVLSGMSDNAVNSLAHQLAAQQYAQIMSALSSIPFKSSWGWNNSPAYIKARNELKTPGDHPDLNGKVPTREEANQMIQEAGGSVDRNDPGHSPGGVSTHTDPHVNYTTPSGQKATVTVREQ